MLRRDPGRRGLAQHASPGALAAAAAALLPGTDPTPSAGVRALLITGFPVRLPTGGFAPETDGPPGARALGDALVALGAEVTYLTCSVCAPILEAVGSAPLEVADLAPGDPAAAALLDRLAPTHLIAIERPGRAADGAYRDMRGRPMTASALDETFLLAADRGITTIAIGDGGNEVGMAALRQAIARAVRHGDEIATVAGCDLPVVAGVSTWGAFALTGALALRANRPELIPRPEAVQDLLAAAVAAGAVDGVTKRPEPTLDGRPRAETEEVLRTITEAVARGSS